jgi:alpha-beta hydrolase superfamily lysophospholipase
MSDWASDTQLPGFEAKTLEFPDDYDGRVVSTLVRLPAAEAPRGAVLYVHGFVDYFFQRHMAERFAAEGYAFHALDLRKHGRSLLAHQHPCFCKDLAEYHADITRALEEIGAPVLLAGRAFPYLNDPKALHPAYVRSIHREFGGEWDFDLKLKPLHGFPAYFGWIGAILAAQAKVHAGLDVGCPVLTMHSDEADIVLDWRHVARWGRTLGREAAVLAFPGGLHDLVLSRREVRDAVFREFFSWAART